MTKNNERGVTLIALVITIIVIIILAGISFVASTGIVDRAYFAKYTAGFDDISESVRKTAAVADTDLVSEGKLITDAQKYNYVAKGGESAEDLIDKNNAPTYSIIEENAKLGTKIPELTTNTVSGSNTKIKFAITSDGTVFSWPPVKKGDEYYVTTTDTVDEETAGKTGDFEITIKGKNLTITVDENSELQDGSILPTNDGRVVLSKPRIKGTYVYAGIEQEVKLVNYNQNVMNISTNMAKDVGTIEITVSLKDPQRYLWTDGTTSDVKLSWTIEKRTVEVKWEAGTTFIYDGSVKVPTATANGVGGETINLNISGGATNTGNYTATASIQSVTGGIAENYELTNTTRDFKIVKGNIEVEAADYEGRYDKQAHTITLTVTKPETGATVYYSQSVALTEDNYQAIGSTTIPTQTELGVSTIYYYVVADGRTPVSGSRTITIHKGIINPTVNMTDYVYGETKPIPTVNGNEENGTVTYYYTTSNATSGGTNWNTVTDSTKINAGSYYMYATVAETTHYLSAVTPAVPFKVERKILTVTADSGKTKVYGTNDPVFTYKYTGNVAGQIPGFNGVLIRNAGEDIGVYTINQGSLTLIDNGVFLANNYKISYVAATMTITQKALTDSDITVTLNNNSFTYNGAEQKAIPTIRYGNKTLVEGTDYTLSYKNNINVGTATVTITAKGNYKGITSKTYTIVKRTITVTAGTASKAYDGKALTNATTTITNGALGTGDTITTTTSGSITDAGSVNNVVSNIVIKKSGVDVTANYNIIKQNGTLTVNKKSVAINWGSTIVFTYNGKSQAPTASAISGVAGESLNITRTTEINAGGYTSTARLSSVSGGRAKASNYTLTGTTKAFTINKKTVNVIWGSTVTFTYNKKWQGPTATVSSGVNSETIVLNSTSAINAGNYTSTASITGVSGGQNNINNYTLSNETKAFTINAYNLKNSTIAEISKYEYDGNAKTPTPAVTVPLDGTTTLTNNVDFTYSYSNNINPGTATVTVTGKGNYTGSKNGNFVIKNSCYHVYKRISSGTSLICNNCGQYLGEISTGQYFKYTSNSAANKNYVVTGINNTVLKIGPKSISDMADPTLYRIAACTGKQNSYFYDSTQVINLMYNTNNNNKYTKSSFAGAGIITSVGNADISVVNREFVNNFRTGIFNKYISNYSDSMNLMNSSGMQIAGYSSDIRNLGTYDNGDSFCSVFTGASGNHDWAVRTFCVTYTTSAGGGAFGLCHYGCDGVEGDDEIEDATYQCPGIENAPIWVDDGYDNKGQFIGYIIPEITLKRCVYFSGSGTQADPYILQGVGNW